MSDWLMRLHALLAQPDPPDLRGRGSRVTCPGDPKRRQSVFLPLLVRWTQHRCLAVDPDPYIAPARPMSAQRLRLFRSRRSA